MKSALLLRPGCIVITIETVNPAADANRYLSSLQRVIQEMQVHPHLDENEHDCLFSLIEFYDKLHPVPSEKDFAEILRRTHPQDYDDLLDAIGY